MPYPPPNQKPIEMLRDIAGARDVERGSKPVDEFDRQREDPASTGRSAWLVVLLGLLGVAGLFVLLYLMARML